MIEETAMKVDLKECIHYPWQICCFLILGFVTEPDTSTQDVLIQNLLYHNAPTHCINFGVRATSFGNSVRHWFSSTTAVKIKSNSTLTECILASAKKLPTVPRHDRDHRLAHFWIKLIANWCCPQRRSTRVQAAGSYANKLSSNWWYGCRLAMKACVTQH